MSLNQTIDALIDKLARIEALHAGATTPGEREAASNARQRILDRLEQARLTSPPIRMRFTLADPWERRLFLALARRYGLKPYRLYRQQRQTVLLDVPPHFADTVLWPQFLALAAELHRLLEAVTQEVIHRAIHGDATEATERGELEG